MKLLPVYVALAAAQGDEKKVPPRHPLQRLERLVEFSDEILDQWYTFLPSKASWKNKFGRNAGRMERNFERGNQICGHYDENQLPHGGPSPGAQNGRKKRSDDYDLFWGDDELRYDRTNPKIGTRQITTGFSKWAERYLAECSGQRDYKYQINRMNNWNAKLQAHLQANQAP